MFTVSESDARRRPQPGKPTPACVRGPRRRIYWAAEHREDLLRSRRSRSVLVRGLDCPTRSHRRCLSAAGYDLCRAGCLRARQAYADGVYSSTKLPPSTDVHASDSLSTRVPRLMLFACLVARLGGATTVAICDRVGIAPVDPVAGFERHGLLLTRPTTTTSERPTLFVRGGGGGRGAIESFAQQAIIEWPTTMLRLAAPQRRGPPRSMAALRVQQIAS